MANSISNTDDVIDSRDVIARIDELKDQLNDKFEEEFREEPIPFLDWLQAKATGEGQDHNPDALGLLELLTQSPDTFSGDDLLRLGDLRNTLQEEWARDMEDRDTPDDAFDTWLKQVKNDPTHLMYEEANEYDDLFELAEEAEGYGDWTYGETLIRRGYWLDYVQQFADDIGAVSRDDKWPNNHIDWQAAADELEHDYMSVDFAGEEYLMRA